VFFEKNGKPKELPIPEATNIFFRKGVEGRKSFGATTEGAWTPYLTVGITKISSGEGFGNHSTSAFF
jgi:hypothetical protein